MTRRMTANYLCAALVALLGGCGGFSDVLVEAARASAKEALHEIADEMVDQAFDNFIDPDDDAWFDLEEELVGDELTDEVFGKPH